MALVESNEARMIGVVPFKNAMPIPVGKIPDDGTQIAKHGNADASIATIHPVTALKTLYLIFFTCTSNNASAVADQCYFYVTNASDVLQYRIIRFDVPAGESDRLSGSFPTPLEIPAGYKVKIETSVANHDGNAFIFGYEV